MVFDEKLTWTPHIDYVKSMANRRFFILRRLKRFINSSKLHTIHLCSIRSILEYSSACFVGIGKTLSDKLNRIDTRAHRIIYSIPFDAEYKPDCGCAKNAVEQRRREASLKLFNHIETSPKHILHLRIPRRGKRCYLLPFSRTTKRLRTFFPHVATLLNDM